MQRTIAALPNSIDELCLVRLGIQVRRISALLYAARLGRAIERSSAEAIATGAGLLSSERFTVARGHFGVLQYWRSFDDLEAWSHRPPHSEWWREAVERMRSRSDLGIFHETFLVPRDRIESIYLNCRPAGLATFGTLAEPIGANANSRGRLGRQAT
jgi:heme-degrading monooxygenase HmoA